MDDLKKACDESSKETTPESVAVVTMTRLKLRNDVEDIQEEGEGKSAVV